MGEIDFRHNAGYRFRGIDFGDSGRERLLRGVRKISDAVGSTLGPCGRTVIMESDIHLGGVGVTKDGVTVARSIYLPDAVENLACLLMKQASERTAVGAGDGTTTAMVIARALVESGIGHSVEVLREVIRLTGGVVDRLKGMSVEVDNLFDVACISANNDEVLGRVIADCYAGVGDGGVVTVENADSEKTYYKVTEGMRIGVGYASQYFINDMRRSRCVMDKARVFVSDITLQNIFQIQGVLEWAHAKQVPLLIVAPCSEKFVQTLARNKVHNNMQVCAVPPPGFGWKKRELLSDIAAVTGAKYFAESTGDELAVTPEDLGVLRKVEVYRSETVMLRDDVDVSERLKEVIGSLDTEKDKEFVRTRIAALQGGVGQIFVGAPSPAEQSEKKDRADDAVWAVRSALEEGIVPGGGVALYEASRHLGEGVAAEILREALRAPYNKIMENAEMNVEAPEGSVGTNAKTGERGDMIEMGIIDPLKVTRLAVQNAVSVAVTILGTDAIVYDHKT